MHFEVHLFSFGCAASSLPHRLFSSCGEGVLVSLVWGTGSSLWRLPSLQSAGSVAAAHELSGPVACGVLWTRD